MTNQEIIDKIKESQFDKIKLAVADIDGILRGKTISKEKFMEAALSGFGFCDVIFGWDSYDSCYDNTEVTGWHTAYPDANARIDLSTLRHVPWDNERPFFLADFSGSNDKYAEICPRTLLKRIKQQGADLGFETRFSQEFEWFNFLGTPNDLSQTNYSKLTPIAPGMFGYSMLRPTQYQDYFNELYDFLLKFGVPLEGIHTETGPGVYEAAIRYDEVLAAADKAILFKSGVKEIASRHGIIASFMAKWDEKLPGCGGHIHQSLWQNGKNAFASGDKNSPLGETMQHYIAGLLFCLPHILPMYAPTVNSFKRLRDGAWAPTTISWGIENRTTSARAIVGKAASTRVEMRIPGSDTNPYLAMAASLASGLYGIKNKLPLSAPVTGNAYTRTDLKKIPANLAEATKAMRESTISRELFGDTFVSHFCATREWEWREFLKAVTNWELKRYFEII